MANFEIVSKRLKIKDKDLLKILDYLQKQALVSKEGESLESELNLNFEEIIENQIPDNPVNYKYTGDLLPFKVSLSSTDKVLDLFGPDAVERKKCYYPYWFIFYDDGDVDVIDALTGEKDKNLVLEDFLDLLSP